MANGGEVTRSKKSLRIAETLERLARLAHSVQFAGAFTPTQWDVLRFRSPLHTTPP